MNNDNLRNIYRIAAISTFITCLACILLACLAWLKLFGLCIGILVISVIIYYYGELNPPIPVVTNILPAPVSVPNQTPPSANMIENTGERVILFDEE